MTETSLLRMAYLGDGISTDDEGFGDESEDEGVPYAPLPSDDEVTDDEELESPAEA